MSTKQPARAWYLYLFIVFSLLASSLGTISVSAQSGFPSTGVLDNFDRANGLLGGNWTGATYGYTIASNRMDVGTGDVVFWNAQYGADQEVFVTLSTIDPASTQQALILKAQSTTSLTAGLIAVVYDAVNHQVLVYTYSNAQGFVQRGANIPVTFANGDQFGARASQSGIVDVYRNGVLLASRTATAWTYTANGGYPGIWFVGAGNALLDDFGGGSVTAGSTSTPTATSTDTVTFTPTSPVVSTGTFTPTLTVTNTFTYTPTSIVVPTSTNTPIPPSATFTLTNTATFTPTYTSTNTLIPPTSTFTLTNTATFTPTNTATSTATYTLAPPTNTNTPTSTPTFTFTPTDTATSTATFTLVPPTNTNTPSSTPTPTFTPTDTATSTPTFTPTNTNTPGPSTPTNTATFTPTNTPFIPATIYRVAVGGATSGSCGASWANPCDLQYALTTLATGNSEIWVKAGTYKPGTTDRNSTFQIKSGQAVYGGFAGTETLRSQRNADPATNGTVLSGDIGTVGVVSDNVYNVVTVTGILSNTFILDGFTVTAGNSNGSSGNGGGIYISNASPTLANLIISNNNASANGGGLFVNSPSATLRVNYSSPTLTNVTFSNNTAARGGGIYAINANPVLTNVTFTGNTANGGAGGGMNNQTLNGATDEYSIPVLTNVIFSGNTATGGGGLFNTNSNPILNAVTFSGNTATRRGGGMLNEFAAPVLTNVTFSGNISNDTGTAPVGGGAVLNIDSDPRFNQVTFTNNTSASGGAIRNIQNSNPLISNSIFWGDSTDELTSDGTGTITVVDSVVQGGFTGTNIVTANPNLGALANNGGFTQTHALGTGSSAIDVGGLNSVCATTDQRGVTRPQENGCDMGAYEYVTPPTPTPTATFTSTPTATVTFTPTNTATATATYTATAIGASTATPTFTPTNTATFTPTLTPSYTPTNTATFTPTNTATLTSTSTPVGPNNIYRVSTSGATSGLCGATWSNPCDLQYALTLAASGDELWVKSGIYKPGSDRTSTFQLKDGVAIYGGFAGTETSRTQRDSDPSTNGTILSGEIGAPGDNSDNTYHVAYAFFISPSSVLDGFTITGGNANGATGNFGGGLYSENSSPILTNLIISNNSTNGAGGGMFVVTNNQTLRVNYSAPVLNKVIFTGNTAVRGGGLFTQNSSPLLTDVIFTGNTATGGAGGGMNNQILDEVNHEYSIPILTNVTFSGNVANGGAGLFNNHSNVLLTNVTFSGNTANIRGGAILNEGASPILRNVTISGNTAPAGFGGSIRNVQNASGAPSNPQIHNSILWGNGSEEITSDGTGSTTIVDSVVQGGFAGTNILTTNPNLSALANNGGFTQTRAIGPGSSAMDVGGLNVPCATTDQRGVTRSQDNGCDMGAYEYKAPPTPTPTATFTSTPTATATFTPTATATFTSTPTHTPTNTPTRTPTNTPTRTPTSTPFGANDIIYLGSTTNGTAGSVTFNDEDILSYNRTTGTWTMYFDGSDVGITGDVDAFARMSDGTILISLDASTTVGSLGTVDPADIIRFTPTSLGANTAGTFSWYFDGSDVGLTTTSENIDSISFAPDGRLIIGTTDSFTVTGVSGNGEDLLAFTSTSLGSTTSGTWAMYFDGSDVGLTNTTEKINGVWIDPANNKIYLTTTGAFSVTGASGDESDIFICTPGTLGNTTTCTFSSYWDGSVNGFSGEDTDGIGIVH